MEHTEGKDGFKKMEFWGKAPLLPRICNVGRERLPGLEGLDLFVYFILLCPEIKRVV